MEIKFDENNYRKHGQKNKRVIKKSVDELGAGRSILVDNENSIIAGNGVYEQWEGKPIKVIETDGSELVVVKRTDLNPADKKRKELALADNQASDLSEFNMELVNGEFTGEELTEWGFDIPEQAEAQEDDYEIPEQITTDILPGDLFQIGPHRLLCGDSTDIEQVKTVMGGVMADLVVTDPPYNVDYTGKTKDLLKIENDKKSDSEFYNFLFDFYSAFGEVTKPGGVWYVWHADSEGANFMKAMNDSGVLVKQCLIWKKNSMVMGRQDYHWQHEPCLYGWKEGAAHGWYSDRKQTTILEFDRPNRNAEHPTMKPISLISYQIKNSSKSGDIVADAFLGSGSTMVAAHQLNRRCYGMELDPKYCQVIIDRMRKLDPEIQIKKNGQPYKTNNMK